MAENKIENPDAEAHDEHTHEVGGFLVGERAIPTSAVLVFTFIFFIALVSWVPMWGF
jgi:hypothetical protein